MLLHKKHVIDCLIYTDNQIHPKEHPKENHILVMTGRNIKNSKNNQLEHLQLMKGTIADVTTVITTTGVMNANNLLI